MVVDNVRLCVCVWGGGGGGGGTYEDSAEEKKPTQKERGTGTKEVLEEKGTQFLRKGKKGKTVFLSILIHRNVITLLKVDVLLRSSLE